MNPRKVLFVCIHNSARSQMAETFLNALGGGRFAAESAGLEPGKLNPVVVEAMREVGFDLAGNATKSVASMIERGPFFDCIITVCDEASAERCPVFPGPGQRLHWLFQDPSGFTGTREEKLVGTRQVRDAIHAQVAAWCAAN